VSMWNKRPQDDTPPAPRPAAASPSTLEPKKEATTPVSSIPMRIPEPESTRGSASIGKAVKVNGQIYSKEDLYVDGDVEGTIELHDNRLTIGPNGKVHAGVKAREVVVLGSIQGNVEASDRLEIRKEGRLVGDIRTARIVIEDGAYFKGSIDIVKPEPSKTQAPPAVAAAPRPNTAPVPGGQSSGVPIAAAEKR
jgi:cytoskeletal protein CcmA (bactofilin family)